METTKSNAENLSLGERKLALQVFIDNYPKEKIHIITHRIGKKKWELPTYEVPIELTYYSHKNSRIGSNIIQYEKTNNVVIEEANPRHMELIGEMLLSSGEDTAELLDQMKMPGQTEAGLITPSGRLINANRRRAALKKIKAKTILVSLLPENLTEQELFEIEILLQVTSDYKEEYTGINRLLMIRRGLNMGHTTEMLMKQFNMTKLHLERGLKVLEKTEEFLEEIGKPYEFSEVEDMLEHFHELIKETDRIQKDDGNVVPIEEVFYGLMAHNIGEKQNIIGHKDVRDTLFYASIDEKIYNLLQSSAEADTKEKMQTDLKIAKDIATMHKKKEMITHTVAKLTKQMASINVTAGFENYAKGNKSLLFHEIQKLEEQAAKFIQEVIDEANKPKYN